jgi:hypothetical protein
VRFFAVCCIVVDGICREGAIVVGLLLNFRLRFPYEIVCFLPHNFLRDFL